MDSLVHLSFKQTIVLKSIRKKIDEHRFFMSELISEATIYDNKFCYIFRIYICFGKSSIILCSYKHPKPVYSVTM